MENRRNNRNNRRSIAIIVIVSIIVVMAIALGYLALRQPKTSAKPAPVHVNVNLDTPMQPRATVCVATLDIQYTVGTQLKVLSEAKQYLRKFAVDDLSIENIRVNLAQGALLVVDDAPMCLARRLWFPVHVSGTDISGWVALSGPDAKGSTNEIQLLDLAD